MCHQPFQPGELPHARRRPSRRISGPSAGQHGDLVSDSEWAFLNYFQALSRDLASFAPGEPPLPADFAALCATVDQVEGVDLAALFNRLPKTRAATGDDALRQVLDLARQQPPPEPETPEPSPE